MSGSAGRSIYILFPQSKNVQRLGSLAIVAKLASATRAATIKDISRNYWSLISSPILVPAPKRDELISYLNRRNLGRKYSLSSADLRIEAQDWFLADPALPSHTGNEKEDVRPTIQLAAQLGLLWATSFQRTWAGDLLAGYTPDILSIFHSGLRDNNPYALNNAQKTTLAFLSIESDQTFLGFLLDILLNAPETINIPTLISEVRRKLDGLIEQVKTTAVGFDDAKLLSYLNELNIQLNRNASLRKANRSSEVTKQTLRRGYEELLYWRLEMLVDLGYLSKPDPDLYTYRATKSLQDLKNTLMSGLTKSFFKHWLISLGIKEASSVDAEHARDMLFVANKTVSNSMGYTLIRQGTLVANIMALNEGDHVVIEVDTAIEAISKGSGKGYKILTSVDRNRNLSAYKMVKY